MKKIVLLFGSERLAAELTPYGNVSIRGMIFSRKTLENIGFTIREV